MSRIAMLLSNPFRPDPRVAREAASLVEAGHSVTVIAWDRQLQRAPSEKYAGVQILRIQDVQARYGGSWRQVFITPRFWKAATRLAESLRPEVVHCHDLDTLYAGVQLKRRTGCRLVYDAHEDYPALMSLYLPAPLIPLLSLFERRLLTYTDHTITASSVLADKLLAQGVRPVTTIGNYQSLAPFDAVTPDQVRAARSELGLSDLDFVVAYIGGFTRNRLLLPLVEAVAPERNLTCLFWGDGHQRQAIQAAIADKPNVRFLGWLPADLVPRYTKSVDVIYYCLVPDYPGAVFNAPNTLGNAMAAGVPILANDVGDLGRIVRETGCGLLLREVTPETIRNALLNLRQPELRRKLGQSGRRAAEQTYNWSTAAQKLNRIYSQLT